MTETKTTDQITRQAEQFGEIIDILAGGGFIPTGDAADDIFPAVHGLARWLARFDAYRFDGETLDTVTFTDDEITLTEANDKGCIMGQTRITGDHGYRCQALAAAIGAPAE